MTRQERASRAEELLRNEFLMGLLDTIEAAAMTAIIYAKPDEHSRRQDKAAEARAIRTLRDQLNAIVNEGKAKEPGKGSIA